MPALHHSVGRNARNDPIDVRLVQRLLNTASKDQVALVVDGVCGPMSRAAIERFQAAAGLDPDGIVDPKGPTLRKLVEYQLQDVVSGLDQGIAVTLKQLPSERQAALAPLLEALWKAMRRLP